MECNDLSQLEFQSISFGIRKERIANVETDWNAMHCQIYKIDIVLVKFDEHVNGNLRQWIDNTQCNTHDVTSFQKYRCMFLFYGTML
jgi:hypothetical protein